MTPSLLARILLIVATLASWIVAWWLLRRHELRKSHSISSHGGADDSAYLVFGTTLTTGALAVLFFGIAYLIPTFKPVPIFPVFLVLSVILQILTAWIREGTGKTLHRWHWIVSFSMAGTWPIMLTLLHATGNLSPLSSALSVIALAVMGVFWALFLWLSPSRKYFLIMQLSYILSFQLAFLAIALAS